MIGLVPADKLADYVGQEIGTSDWFEVDQDRINTFADATLDHQFIHVDTCLLYTSPSPRDGLLSRMPSSA